MSKRQDMVSFSTTKEKYMAIAHAYKEFISLMKLCLEVGLSERAITVQCDSNNLICLTKNINFHVKTKHIL